MKFLLKKLIILTLHYFIRSSTDILEALSATVQKVSFSFFYKFFSFIIYLQDYTGPHYMYVDDSLLSPKNSQEKVSSFNVVLVLI